MTKVFSFVFVLLISLPVFSQKVPVQVTKSRIAAGSDWQILDTDFLPVISGSGFPGLDSVSFGLEENKRYYLEVSVLPLSRRDTSLFLLYINSEPVLLVRSDIAPGDHFYSFFTGVRQVQGKVTGGVNASITDFPWQVFMEAANYTCGGSIISSDWIITAAHCTEDDFGNLIPASQMDVIVGANNPRSGLEGKKYFVSKVIRHENFNHTTLNNDIALLQLSASINYPNATPIRLVSKIDSAAGATDPGVMAWLTGYGLTKVSPPTEPTVLQKLQIPLVTNTQASTVWPDIAPSDMMAGYRSGNKDACNGDSGGPLIVPVDNEYKVAGLVSWGSSNCNTYGAYTRVSMFESWISSKTGIEIAYVPPVPSGDSIVCRGIASSLYSTGAITGATAYEWQLLPTAAGAIQGNSEQATVTWDQGFTGAATVRLRVTKFNVISYWSALTVHIAEYNALAGKSNDTILCAGKPVTLKVNAKGYNLNYSWLKDGIPLQSGKSPELVIKSTTTDSTGVYRCNISGSCGDPLSPDIHLTVLPVTVVKKITPDTKAAFGDNVTLEVDAGGHNLLYQWLIDEKQIAEATGPIYTLMNVNASNTGLYKVDIAGTCGEVLSNNVYIYVTDNISQTQTELFVWPTLVSSEFNVAPGTDEMYSYRLYSSTGRLIREKNNCQYKTVIDLTDVPGGVYIISVYGSSFHKTVKIIKN
jgi:secreted trypsin-like serine protease